MQKSSVVRGQALAAALPPDATATVSDPVAPIPQSAGVIVVQGQQLERALVTGKGFLLVFDDIK